MTATAGACAAPTATAAASIKLNQLGFLPASAKLAVVPASPATVFSVTNTATGAVAWHGMLGTPARWAPSGEIVSLADFSGLTAPGDYQIKVDGLTGSTRFTIGTDVYRALSEAALKAFYFNRASTALPAQYAGAYARAAGHPDTQVLVHRSAASAARPEGTVIASPKGWYDAGDYNKYMVNSGIATYTLLAAYEHFPAYFQAQHVNLPESGNGIPDILNEALWNLEWMLSMQDPDDGGVYHKLTNKTFDPMVMPEQATSPRYVVQKTTAATLDFAAVMASASRVLRPYQDKLPGLPAKMLAAAKAAWAWAQAHPDQVYRQPADIVTGEYGDAKLDDEFMWAAAELYISTADDSYYRAMPPAAGPATVPAWDDVGSLAWISLAHHRDALSPIADRALITNRIMTLADALLAASKHSAYAVAMQPADFVWGSNAVALNQAIMLLQAYRLGGQRAYLNAAQSAFDYVLGRNATGYAFVTGFGSRSPLHPHHRPSQADHVAAPVPGFLVGGPQPGQQDQRECAQAYPSHLAAQSYLDQVCSYASNEIAINWNAPLVYVAAALASLPPAPVAP
ncbi:glycoside hydrolase family 9 protein [Duganella sp. LX20W]|uniref:Endoglucanase n=2 Tax=Rugamonas brunnea TaxID=2758569 RepID=A0A7W2EQS7_9BURK|nr:glycoside hydrolase family 9 protein [Rugamonas brunnea]